MRTAWAKFAILPVVVVLTARAPRLVSHPPCLPVVVYDRAFLARTVKELDLLPPESAIVDML